VPDLFPARRPNTLELLVTAGLALAGTLSVVGEGALPVPVLVMVMVIVIGVPSPTVRLPKASTKATNVVSKPRLPRVGACP